MKDETGQRTDAKLNTMDFESKRKQAAQQNLGIESDGWERVHNARSINYYIRDSANPDGPALKRVFNVICAPQPTEVSETSSLVKHA